MTSWYQIADRVKFSLNDKTDYFIKIALVLAKYEFCADSSNWEIPSENYEQNFRSWTQFVIKNGYDMRIPIKVFLQGGVPSCDKELRDYLKSLTI
jgi:hypothetical protein